MYKRQVIGAPLQSLMEIAVDFIGSTIITFLTNHQVAPWLISLLRDGVIAGVGSVLSFLPLIVVLFFFLSMLEDSGYMARVAFVMDKLLRKIGLSGKSFVPMLIGFGCSVPVSYTHLDVYKRQELLFVRMSTFIAD